MDVKKVVIIGGVAGGASAGARLRRINENIEIIIFEKGEYISFANCGLPYYIGDIINNKEKLLVQTPQGMKSRFNIDVRVNSEVVKIYTDTKEVEVVNKVDSKIYRETYDKLILSPGAEPIRPPIPGCDSKKIFTLRNIPDTFAIKDYIQNNKINSAVVIGAGYIGIEMAENINHLGINTTIVELSDHVMGPLDFDMAAIVHQHMRIKNIELFLNDAVKSFSDDGHGINIELNSGKTIKADIAIMAIGVRPETTLAQSAGLDIGERRGICVNEYMQTSNPDIYAVGDAIEVVDYINGEKAVIPLAGPANKQGRIAANNICGGNEKYTGTQGTSIIKVFDLTVGGTGNNESALKRNNIDYLKTYIHSASHAGYYPGASPLTIKLLFSPSCGKILGTQIIGFDGVDKRIDIIATAIRGGMTVYDLEKLELSYAPPYSSAKDPINMAGFTAVNILKNDHRVIYWDQIDSVDREKTFLIDVRTSLENSLATIDGAINIPIDELRERISEIPKDKKIIIFCEVGLRGYIAYRILTQNGYEDVVNLSGGFKTYNLCKSKQSNIDIFENDKIENNDVLAVKKNELEYNEYQLEKKNIDVDACGLQCPGPILKVFNEMKGLAEGDVLKISATDPGFENDIKVWCTNTNNELVDIKNDGRIIIVRIKKGMKADQVKKTDMPISKKKSIIVFSSDLDKVIASFVIANGAVAMGNEVTMFFTFWGLNVLRKNEKVKVSKNIIEKMFGLMMPRGSRRLKLSTMNMSGMGKTIIRRLMVSKNIGSLESMIEQARKLGVKFIACNMSMDLIGIKREELPDDIEIGGVASFLAEAEKSDTTLFI